jgi:hypothetical protein
MLRQMKSHATNTQGPFYILKAISRASEGMVDVHRFTADTGLHKIKLDEYKKLGEIQKLTNEYIDRPEVVQELREVAEKLANGWKEQHSPNPAPMPTSDGEVVGNLVTDPHFPRRQDTILSGVRRHATNLLPDTADPFQDTSIQHVAPPTAPDVFIQPPERPSPNQPSPLTMPGSTSGSDVLADDTIDLGLASDRAEPLERTTLTIQERARDPLPDNLSSRSAHPTSSLNGTTPTSSPNRNLMRENGPYVDSSDKELAMGLGGQFGPHEPVS